MQRPHFLGALTAFGAALTAGGGRPEPALAVTPTPANIRSLLKANQRIVAYAMSDMATVIDFAGPWEVFGIPNLPGSDVDAFVQVMVGETMGTIEGSSGMWLSPRYTFANAPRPDVIVVGAQHGSPGLIPWLQREAPHAELVMSVCTGAFKVAEAGLFDGKRATTHHDFYDKFEKAFPKVTLQRGPRFVDQGRVCSAGGLTSGINLALHVVERFHGAKVADRVARYMEFTRTERPAAERRA